MVIRRAPASGTSLIVADRHASHETLEAADEAPLERMVAAALGWCRARNLDLMILHASEAGKPPCAAPGFKPSTHMGLFLPEAG